jgi:hypothetical protein
MQVRVLPKAPCRHSGTAARPGPESITTVPDYGFRARRCAAPIPRAWRTGVRAWLPPRRCEFDPRRPRHSPLGLAGEGRALIRRAGRIVTGTSDQPGLVQQPERPFVAREIVGQHHGSGPIRECGATAARRSPKPSITVRIRALPPSSIRISRCHRRSSDVAAIADGGAAPRDFRDAAAPRLEGGRQSSVANQEYSRRTKGQLIQTATTESCGRRLRPGTTCVTRPRGGARLSPNIHGMLSQMGYRLDAVVAGCGRTLLPSTRLTGGLRIT